MSNISNEVKKEEMLTKILYKELLVCKSNDEYLMINLWQLEEYFNTGDRGQVIEQYKLLPHEEKVNLFSVFEFDFKTYFDEKDWLQFIEDRKNDFNTLQLQETGQPI